MKETFDFTKYSYLENRLPCLILAIKHDILNPRTYKFKNNDFEFISHQSMGLACNQLYFQAKVLKIKEKHLSKLKKIENTFYDSSLGCFGASLTDILKYRELLNKIPGADCEISYSDLQESVYPIDLTQETVNELTEETLDVGKLDDLIEFKDSLDKILGCMGRWSLFYLTENSD